MIFGSFLKGSAPWTRRQNIWFGVYCVTCIVVAGAVFSVDRWADASIRRQLSDDGAKAIIQVDAVIFRCSQQYFWGHDVLLDRPDGIRVWRRVCRDWTEGRWYPAGGL